MTISEKKMQIVIDNYFKSECDVNTSIRQAFEKGFKIGIKKVPSTGRKGHWVGVCEYCHHLTEVTGELYLPSGFRNHYICDQCWQSALEKSDYCPNCGADMRGVDDESTL